LRRHEYDDLPRHGFTYLALQLEIKRLNKGKDIFLEGSLKLRADAGEITLPTAKQLKEAFASANITYDGAVDQIRGDLSGQLQPPNCPGAFASQKKLEEAGLTFKK